MKRTYIKLLGLIFLLFFGCISFRPMIYTETVDVTKTTLIDEREVDIHAWLSYYSWIKKNEGEIEANKVLPDSSCVEPEIWQLIKHKSSLTNEQTSIFTNQPLGYFQSNFYDSLIRIKNNKRLPSFYNILMYPITGVTYDQVINFCKWRTKIINSEKVTYRLPTEKEWIDIAKKGFSESEAIQGFKDSLYQKKVCPMFNFKVTKCYCEYSKEYEINRIQGPGNYAPDKLKIYDLFGNVSEMTFNKGISKGGNFTIFASQCHPDSIQNYTKPEKWLGFRCVADITK